MAQYNLGKVSIRPRGAYATNTNYAILDTVQSNGGSWLALAASKDIQPGVTSGWRNYWMMIARGIQTIVGSSPADGQTKITITFSDGSTAEYTYDNEVLSDGSVTRAKLAGDALYSPVRKYTATSYDIIADDLGKTLADGFSLRNDNITLTMSKALMDAAPVGAEIAFARTYNMKSIKLTTTGARIINIDAGQIGGASATVTLSLPERGSMFALKKIEQDNTYGSFWILTGNVEVVS